VQYLWNKIIDFYKQEDPQKAKRALGRSPKEKVKGHCGAIYRVPLVILSIIANKKALQFQTIIFLKVAFQKPIFWPRDLLVKQIRTIWAIMVEDYLGIIPIEFGQIPISNWR